MRFAELVMFAWVPVSLVLFACLKPRHAVLTAYIGAWLFLSPRAGIKVTMLPDLTKVTISTFAVLFGVMLFDAPRLFTFRPRWFDLPMLAWCTLPFMSSVTNGLGYWDGLSAILEKVILWGIPYFLGRVYFNDWEGFRELAVAIFLGGLIYVPLCLLEIRMSPQLHKWVYGSHQHVFDQTKRFGGFRPTVFMQHGLAVGFWMTAASLVGVWLLVSGAKKTVLGIPMLVVVPVLLVTTVLCKSAAGVGFLAMGVAALFAMKWTKTAIPLYCLVAFAPVYMYARTSGAVTGEWAVATATDLFGPDRAQSLDYRFNAENLLTARAMEKPWFGFGRFDKVTGRAAWMVRDPKTRKYVAPDGMWVITLGINGVAGVVALTSVILLPALLLRWRVPPGWWGHPMAAPAAACAILLTLHMADNMLNAMVNPVFIVAIGGLSALGLRTAAQAAQPQAAAYAARRPVAPPPRNIPLGRPVPSAARAGAYAGR
jgi:hypothetical protein